MQLVEKMHEIMEQEFRDKFNVPEWHYRDIPSIRVDFWNMLVEALGKENLIVISGSRRQIRKGTGKEEFFRCSCMISPEGMDRLKKFNAP